MNKFLDDDYVPQNLNLGCSLFLHFNRQLSFIVRIPLLSKLYKIIENLWLCQQIVFTLGLRIKVFNFSSSVLMGSSGFDFP